MKKSLFQSSTRLIERSIFNFFFTFSKSFYILNVIHKRKQFLTSLVWPSSRKSVILVVYKAWNRLFKGTGIFHTNFEEIKYMLAMCWWLHSRYIWYSTWFIISWTVSMSWTYFWLILFNPFLISLKMLALFSSLFYKPVIALIDCY